MAGRRNVTPIPAALLMLAIAISAAQTDAGQVFVPGSQPPRDRAPVPTRGTAAIAGRVVDGATGAPIARARVRLGGGGPRRVSVLTDGSGSFAFSGLPAGAYTVTAEKATYLPGRYPDGGSTLRSRGRPLMLRDGQAERDISIPLFRGGAIVGRVVDAHGDPVENASVQMIRVPRSLRVTNAGMPGMTATNDLGEFRAGRLSAGNYLLFVVVRNRGPEDLLYEGKPAPQPLPTYYPGVLALEQAHTITVERGETVTGIEVILAEGAWGIVSGILLDPEGRPSSTGGSVNARAIVKGMPGGLWGSGSGAGPDGRFRMQLAPGEYLLEGRLAQPGSPSRPTSELYGTARISVSGGEIQEVAIAVGRGAIAAGRVVFEGTGPPPPPGPVHVPLFSPDGECRSGPAQVSLDWTFRIEGLFGTCSAPPGQAFGRWSIKAVMHRGEDMLERPVTFEPGQQYRDVEIVVTDVRTELTFRVSDDKGQPTREYVALVFPVNRDRWQPGIGYPRTYVPPSRAPAFGRASAPSPGAGAVPLPPDTMSGLLALGEYFVVALDDLAIEDSQDPDILDRLVAVATRVTLIPGNRTEVPLRRIDSAAFLRR